MQKEVKRFAQGHSADQWQFWKYYSHLVSKSHSLLEENPFFHRELLCSVGSISLVITNHYFPVQKVWIVSYQPCVSPGGYPCPFNKLQEMSAFLVTVNPSDGLINLHLGA